METQLPRPHRATAPLFGPYLLWRNGWMDQDATWYEGKPRPRRYCVIWGSCSPLEKGHSHHFADHVYCGQTAGWTKMPLGTKVGLGPGHIVLDGAKLPQKKGTPNFRPIAIVAKRSPISATAEHLLYSRAAVDSISSDTARRAILILCIVYVTACDLGLSFSFNTSIKITGHVWFPFDV